MKPKKPKSQLEFPDSETRGMVRWILCRPFWTQDRLAEVLNVTRRQVCRYSSGEQQAPPDRMERLRRVYQRERGGVV